jgi:hypothetical protein
MLVVPYILVIKVNISQPNVHFLLGKSFILHFAQHVSDLTEPIIRSTLSFMQPYVFG